MAVLPVLFGVFGAGWLASGATVRHFEARSARFLASRLAGPGRIVQVKTRTDLGALFGHVRRATIFASQFESDGLPLFVEPGRSQKGVLNRLEMKLTDFTLSGLKVARLEASIPACRFDLAAVSHGQFWISRSGTGTGTVEVKLEELGKFLTRKYPQVKSARVLAIGNRVSVVGEAELLLLKAKFDIEAGLEIRDGSKLFLRDVVVRLDGREAPAATSGALLKVLNPVVDLDRDLKLHGAIKVTTARLTDSALIASGTTTIPVRPKQE